MARDTAPDWVAGERRDLASMLARLTPEQWDAPSLCAGWRSREVIAHITMPYRLSTPRILLKMVKARGNFNRMSDAQAREDARTLTADALLHTLEENVAHPWKPPGGGFEGALSHDVIHGLDVSVALGLGRRVPDDRLDRVLGGVGPKHVKYFGTDLAGVQLTADDRAWTYGAGAPLRGSAQDLLLVLCGRRLPPGHLTGEPSPRFTATV
ncbi:maleylpyruvate isomerase family mycothiol-dependent enzyme [Rhodococcus opacus]|uniref:Maleylpyruvate isomerase family mycothiol-dependent enzyme n=1 Tax=Rhodococcus opacus TaxID=37919 RepID=A0AAX3YQJ4_RHOOP|nr:maleylpyruvate isomerase family mycothiol-dependent enzyme [Rhodococcus opacus]MCZ4584401.1 maleylpyruvate isomerase family mycothiol-dependent enzyme [Rhodococcus opacus]MDJ0419550.1 maleylpyruvate isomerase family mycothiol-dependent enzyme [Rhodococcus opacus]MDV6241762.1 maleylpyruvate isomerase family mycothiol-dependent enzyme [Rhodococcus opacus]UNN01818.1 maleylpyruvate isomerase family mycothiol-dependent enzyme [Rhodococcus opacus]UOT00948.1 maleylpyruvate isomerase family mycothi